MKRSNRHPLAYALERNDHLDRYVIHLRQRRTQRNLNLVLGAGATTAAGTPLWPELIERIRRQINDQFKGNVSPLKEVGPAMAAEVLLKWLEDKIEGDLSYKKYKVDSDRKSKFANNRWTEAIKTAIYKGVPTGNEQRTKKHQYLQSLASLVARCPLTINFNFDDVVDRATQKVCEDHAFGLPHIVWALPFGYQSKGATILHINGFLPDSGKSDSGRLILTEGAFAELMMQQTNYQSIALLRSFAETTMLIIGCSLEDSSLKAILRSSAQINPSNFHYIIHFVGNNEKAMTPHLKKIFEANKSVYNLITIFLRQDEYDHFLKMIALMESSEFEVSLKELDSKARSKLLYYVVGAVGCGKTTLIRNLRLFQTHEEWGAQPPPEMYKDTSTLTEKDKVKVDAFLKSQLRHKNEIMRKADIGFHVMDRAFLDLIAFSDADVENQAKLLMIETFVAGHEGLQDGCVIFLCAEGEQLEDSQWSRGQLPKRFGGKGFTITTLDRQQKLLRKIYDPPADCVFDSRSAAPAEFAKMVAFRILSGKYEPVKFSDRIKYVRLKKLASLYASTKRPATKKRRTI